MKHSFIILAHKNPEQLQKLCDYLLSCKCDVIVHVDKKVREDFKDFSHRNQGRAGLRIFSRFSVYWGSFNQIRATFFLLEEALKNTETDFVSLISGQDLPLQPILNFNSFLEKNKDRSFLSFQKIPEQSDWDGNGGLDRMELFWILAFPKKLGFIFNRLNVLIHLFQNKLGLRKKVKLQLYGGANWFTLNRAMATYAANYVKTNPGFLKLFRRSRCADEIILQTILLNSEFKNQISNDCLRFIDWSTGPEYPHIFRSSDQKRLETSQNFFARKFDEQVDAQIIDELYKRLQ
jgi:hypothetical protein